MLTPKTSDVVTTIVSFLSRCNMIERQLKKRDLLTKSGPTEHVCVGFVFLRPTYAELLRIQCYGAIEQMFFAV